MHAESFIDFLAESILALEREVPLAHSTMCRVLAGREVRLDVDGDHFAVVFEIDSASILAEPRSSNVDVKTSRDTILELIDARLTLVDALFAETLHVQGDPTDVLAFLDGLGAYLQGAVRSPSFPGLLRRYRAAAPEP
jgi:hypothetical protein